MIGHIVEFSSQSAALFERHPLMHTHRSGPQWLPLLLALEGPRWKSQMTSNERQVQVYILDVQIQVEHTPAYLSLMLPSLIAAIITLLSLCTANGLFDSLIDCLMSAGWL